MFFWGAFIFSLENPDTNPTPVRHHRSNTCQVVQVLLAWRGDVNGRDYDGETPLHLAVKLGDVELAGLSLGDGATEGEGFLKFPWGC